MVWRTTVVVVAGVLALGSAQAQQPAASASQPALVYTRATVQSVFAEDGGRRHYIRLKLGPGSGLPFRTQTFRVRDMALIADFPPGSGVEFVARRQDGENTLVALRGTARIQRFETH